MNGRQEADKKVEELIIKKLKQSPSIITRYYYWLSENKTMKCKNQYVNGVIKFSHYLIKEYKKSIDDVVFLNTITKSDLQRYSSSLKYKTLKDGTIKNNGESGIRTNMYGVKSFFDFLFDEEIIKTNPFDRYEMPADKKQNPVVYLTSQEINKIKKNILKTSTYPERDLAIFTLGTRTGLRASAIIAINIDDINWDDNSIRVVEKGNISKVVYFGDDTKEILLKWMTKRENVNSNAFFLSRKKTRISYIVIKTIMDDASGIIGKHLTPHKMRSTCATNLYKKTNDIYLVADVLGHKNLANTRRYADIPTENKKKAAEILDRL